MATARPLARNGPGRGSSPRPASTSIAPQVSAVAITCTTRSSSRPCVRGGPCRGNHEARHVPHLSPFVRDALAGGRRGHQDGSATARPLRRQLDDDRYPRPQPGAARSAESGGPGSWRAWADWGRRVTSVGRGYTGLLTRRGVRCRDDSSCARFFDSGGIEIGGCRVIQTRLTGLGRIADAKAYVTILEREESLVGDRLAIAQAASVRQARQNAGAVLAGRGARGRTSPPHHAVTYCCVALRPVA